MEIDQESDDILRPMRCELNYLANPDGSVIISQGETVVVASIYGPADVRPQKQLSDRSYLEAIYRPNAGQSLVCDRERESFLKCTCESVVRTVTYPRTGVSVIVQKVQDFGGLLACAINAVCLALLNSGIEMNCVICAVSAMVADDDQIIIDPDHIKLKASKGRMTFTFDNCENKIVNSYTEGTFTEAQYHEALLRCKLISGQIFKTFRNTVARYNHS
ncbi:exosome complex component RRP46 isoform X2 [Nilaparvata lugens]|uniref:exosome complex component RRP46 isoform X2 n=1 Tax=Nilaparvata lugens TaxID=108931 RepID=UPI00193E6DD1|nr:exosome complex component RRP46 isoform X2 [Nilaparvata lugens]